MQKGGGFAFRSILCDRRCSDASSMTTFGYGVCLVLPLLLLFASLLQSPKRVVEKVLTVLESSLLFPDGAEPPCSVSMYLQHP